jgi:hypothetical protein
LNEPGAQPNVLLFGISRGETTLEEKAVNATNSTLLGIGRGTMTLARRESKEIEVTEVTGPAR